MSTFAGSTIDRRHLLTGIASLPLATVLADPRLARAAAFTLKEVTINTKAGRNVTAHLALPEKAPAGAVLLIHEWWGLNDQIKAVAADFAKQGYLGLAVDLYGGKVASEPDGARTLMQAVDPAAATDTLVSWGAWLRSHEMGSGKLATCGWCFGGGWSLEASIAAQVDATVIYYGRVNKSAEELASLQGPVLGHFATEDKFINREMVAGFEAEMKKAGKTYQVHWYEADHAFANPTGARYDAGDAALAWERTTAFLKETLG